VDEDIGFCPRRVEVRWKNSVVSDSITDFIDYREIKDNVWFPMTLSSRCEDAQFGKTTNICRVQEIKAGSSKTKEALLVTFPSGTEVYDRNLDATYTVP
jgi:hypothetical protein